MVSAQRGRHAAWILSEDHLVDFSLVVAAVQSMALLWKLFDCKHLAIIDPLCKIDNGAAALAEDPHLFVSFGKS